MSRSHLTGSLGWAITAGESEIYDWRSGPRELLPGVDAVVFDQIPIDLDNFEQGGIHHALCVTTSRIGVEAPSPFVTKDTRRKDRAGRVPGGEEQNT